MPDTMGNEIPAGKRSDTQGKKSQTFWVPLCSKPETFTKEDLEKSFQREKKTKNLMSVLDKNAFRLLRLWAKSTTDWNLLLWNISEIGKQEINYAILNAIWEIRCFHEISVVKVLKKCAWKLLRFSVQCLQCGKTRNSLSRKNIL